jgi:quercetin dioxygenase-like cupin family protein
MEHRPIAATVKTPAQNFTGDVYLTPVFNGDGTVIRLRAGETVWTPAGEEHWHGGSAENMMCHYAILEETPASDATTWLEPVTDQQYAAANSAANATA